MMTTAAMMSASNVKAIGHESRPETADFDIECEARMMNGERTFFLSSFVIKKYRPPRPMDVKGGCSPQNNLGKLRCK